MSPNHASLHALGLGLASQSTVHAERSCTSSCLAQHLNIRSVIFPCWSETVQCTKPSSTVLVWLAVLTGISLSESMKKDLLLMLKPFLLCPSKRLHIYDLILTYHH